YACIEANQRSAGTIIAKQDCILAGIGCIARIFEVYAVLDGAVTSHYDVTTHPEIFDGVRLHKGQSVAVVRHNARLILSCERVILNFLQRMSGIATLTRQFVEAVFLDNMSVADVKQAVARCSQMDRRIPVECSGGVNLENVRAYAETGVQFISVGALTHSAVAVDMSLRVSPA